MLFAFFTGMLNFQRPEEPANKEKKSPEIRQESNLKLKRKMKLK